MKSSDGSTEMEAIYRTVSPENIPWNLREPPGALVHFLNQGVVRPCRCIDLGCGLGHYTVYMASRGFDATGVDVSHTAIRMAKQYAREAGIQCRFVTVDLLDLLTDDLGMFDFAYDWELLHHIDPGHRDRYLQNVVRLLNPGGYYLSVSFSDTDSQFGGSGKYRKTRLGTVLYFSSETELRMLFSHYFNIIALHAIEIPGKTKPHRANYALCERVSD
jgi:2-polyprenyl-3-methyl-5-hydroxy-6-metoxy-1,4-benzoquinol methylase